MRCSVPCAHGTSWAEKGAQDLSLTNCTEFMGPDRTALEGTSRPFCSFTVQLTWICFGAGQSGPGWGGCGQDQGSPACPSLST